MRDAEPPGLVERRRRFADRPTASPKLWMDGYLAAFAVDAELNSSSSDR
ncbi:MAG: hypothetical protein L0H84_06535 [Pseudonocardia sp.]|nr:hypothetical protein [Pseudonocardia sp.]